MNTKTAHIATAILSAAALIAGLAFFASIAAPQSAQAQSCRTVNVDSGSVLSRAISSDGEGFVSEEDVFLIDPNDFSLNTNEYIRSVSVDARVSAQISGPNCGDSTAQCDAQASVEIGPNGSATGRQVIRVSVPNNQAGGNSEADSRALTYTRDASFAGQSIRLRAYAEASIVNNSSGGSGGDQFNNQDGVRVLSATGNASTNQEDGFTMEVCSVPNEVTARDDGRPDAICIEENTDSDVFVLRNDSPDGLSIDQITSQPDHGTAVIGSNNGEGVIRYSPTPGVYGRTGISYRATDGAGGYDTARVFLDHQPTCGNVRISADNSFRPSPDGSQPRVNGRYDTNGDGTPDATGWMNWSDAANAGWNVPLYAEYTPFEIRENDIEPPYGYRLTERGRTAADGTPEPSFARRLEGSIVSQSIQPAAPNVINLRRSTVDAGQESEPEPPTANRAPTAVASADSGEQIQTNRRRFNLIGTQSSDPDGDSLNYTWEVIAAESDSADQQPNIYSGANLSNSGRATGSSVVVTNPREDTTITYTLELTVSDEQYSDSDTVRLHVTCTNTAEEGAVCTRAEDGGGSEFQQ